VEDESVQESAVEFAEAVVCDETKSFTLLSACLYMIMLIEKDTNWFYVSRTSIAASSPVFSKMKVDLSLKVSGPRSVTYDLL
jgi:hypothetical protein